MGEAAPEHARLHAPAPHPQHPFHSPSHPPSSLPLPPTPPTPAGEHPDRLPSDERLEAATGLPAGGVAQAQDTVRTLLRGDTSSISAVRVLKLYLERLGADFSHPGERACEGGVWGVWVWGVHALSSASWT